MPIIEEERNLIISLSSEEEVALFLNILSTQLDVAIDELGFDFEKEEIEIKNFDTEEWLVQNIYHLEHSFQVNVVRMIINNILCEVLQREAIAGKDYAVKKSSNV